MVRASCQPALVLLLLLLTTTPVFSQEESQEVAIIKQINRVNEDGTYTFGYEAADGSFKIETRDVLGNVKGMFGFIDESGELKRVSYSASNGTGFQASANIVRPELAPTRRPVLIYRGTTRSPVIQHIPRRTPEDSTAAPATTPTYDYGQRTYQTTTPLPDAQRPPIRVLVTKRPVVNDKSVNLIRRQLFPEQGRTRDSPDIYQPGAAVPRVLPQRFRYPQIVGPDPREVYRNMLLEQNNLKPEYSNSRVRYYTPVDEEEYPEVPAVVPMVDRVLANRQSRYRPGPVVVDQQGYPVPDRRFVSPRYPPRVPRPYDDYLPPIDYEALREEIMNYLIQYLQFRTRRVNPYNYYYQPSPQPESPYNVPPPRAPYYPRYPQPTPGPIGPPGPQPPLYPGYALSSPNIQYSQPEQQQQQQQQQQQIQDDNTQNESGLSHLKERMDRHDHRDSSDTRPPSSALIRMLLARPSTQRPSVRSVEILSTAASSHSQHSTTTSTTTELPDEMVAAS